MSTIINNVVTVVTSANRELVLTEEIHDEVVSINADVLKLQRAAQKLARAKLRRRGFYRSMANYNVVDVTAA